MERVKKIYLKGKEIVYVDYSNIKKEDEMIAVHRAHLEFVYRENKRYVYLADYTGSYTTPKYVKEIYNSLHNNKNLIIKGAFLGITGGKGIILSTVISLFGLNFKTFNDKNQALDYLVSVS
jgi:hypothetical protein